MRQIKKKVKSYVRETLLPGTVTVIGTTVTGLAKFLRDLVITNSKLLIILLGILWFVDNRIDTSILTNYLDSSRSEFKSGEVSKVEVDCRDNTAITQKKGEEPKLYTGVKYFRGSKFEDGRIKTKFKNKGFGLEPGIVVTAGDGLRLGVDLEYAYWKRWGLLAGATAPVRGRSFDRVRGHLGLGYDLPSRWFSSTSFYGGIDSDKTPTMGFRTKFGGGI